MNGEIERGVDWGDDKRGGIGMGKSRMNDVGQC